MGCRCSAGQPRTTRGTGPGTRSSCSRSWASPQVSTARAAPRPRLRAGNDRDPARCPCRTRWSPSTPSPRCSLSFVARRRANVVAVRGERGGGRRELGDVSARQRSAARSTGSTASSSCRAARRSDVRRRAARRLARPERGAVAPFSRSRATCSGSGRRCASPAFATSRRSRTSPFSEVDELWAMVERTWTVDQLIGFAYSTSFASPLRVGERRDEFESAMRQRLQPHYRERLSRVRAARTSSPMTDWASVAEAKRARYDTPHGELDERAVVRLGNAAYAAGLSLLMAGSPAAAEWLLRAAERWRASWDLGARRRFVGAAGRRAEGGAARRRRASPWTTSRAGRSGSRRPTPRRRSAATRRRWPCSRRRRFEDAASLAGALRGARRLSARRCRARSLRSPAATRPSSAGRGLSRALVRDARGVPRGRRRRGHGARPPGARATARARAASCRRRPCCLPSSRFRPARSPGGTRS